MNEYRRLLDALEGVVGEDAVGPMRWTYEKERASGRIILPPPPAEVSAGPFRLGQVKWKDQVVGDFGLREHELPQHLSVFGRTGAGKTNCARLLLMEMIRHQKQFLVFDWKQSYRGLCEEYGVALYTPGNGSKSFFFNPLDVSGLPLQSQNAYLRHLVSVLLGVYFRDLQLLSVEGAEYLLLRGIDTIRREGQLLTFGSLYRWLLGYGASYREKDWKSALLNMLYKLTTGPLGEVVNQRSKVQIADLVRSQSVIELQWLGSPKEKSFVVQALFLQLYYVASQFSSCNSLKLLVLIEEAHHVLLKHAGGYETVVEMILRQIREYGVGICLVDQHPSLMSLPALGSYAVIAFNVRTREDKWALASVMGLEGDEEYFGYLRRGEAVVKIQDRWVKPFLVEMPLVGMENIDVGEIEREFMREIEKLDAVDCDLPVSAGISGEISRIEDCGGQKVKKEVCDLSDSAGISGEIPGMGGISDPDKVKVKSLLKDIVEYPLDGVVDRYKRLGWNPREGNAVKERVVDLRLVKPVKITHGKRRIRLFEVTGFGKEVLKGEGVKVNGSWRRGGVLHQYWCKAVKKEYEEKGYKVFEEYRIGGGKAVDLMAVKGEERVAIEIETGKSNWRENVRKCGEMELQIKVVNI